MSQFVAVYGLEQSAHTVLQIGGTVIMTLKAAVPGTRVIVQKLVGQGKVKRRLMDMGIIPGTEIEVQKVAPLGDPVEIKFKGYNLSLRQKEAELVLVEEKNA